MRQRSVPGTRILPTSCDPVLGISTNRPVLIIGRLAATGMLFRIKQAIGEERLLSILIAHKKKVKMVSMRKGLV